MSLTAYLWGIRLFTLLALCAWLGIVIAVDPDQGTLSVALFFLSLFAFVLGLMILFVTRMYRMALDETSVAHHLGSIFRQAFLLAAFAVGLVYFQKERILLWWVALLYLALILLVEFSFRVLFSSPQHQ